MFKVLILTNKTLPALNSAPSVILGQVDVLPKFILLVLASVFALIFHWCRCNFFNSCSLIVRSRALLSTLCGPLRYTCLLMQGLMKSEGKDNPGADGCVLCSCVFFSCLQSFPSQWEVTTLPWGGLKVLQQKLFILILFWFILCN